MQYAYVCAVSDVTGLSLSDFLYDRDNSTTKGRFSLIFHQTARKYTVFLFLSSLKLIQLILAELWRFAAKTLRDLKILFKLGASEKVPKCDFFLSLIFFRGCTEKRPHHACNSFRLYRCLVAKYRKFRLTDVGESWSGKNL